MSKSERLLQRAVELCQRTAGHYGLILSPTHVRSRALFGSPPKGVRDRVTLKVSSLTWVFPNGSKLQFGYLDHPTSLVERYGAPEYSFFGQEPLLSEAEEAFMKSKVRLRPEGDVFP